jgi:hypothetical protein
VPVCDREVAALVIADSLGYRFDCTPVEVELPVNKDGWVDHEHRVLYVRPDPDALYTAWVMWHELGHAAYTVRYGLGGTQAQREAWASAYSWCHRPLPGFSYRLKPADCTPYQ